MTTKGNGRFGRDLYLNPIDSNFFCEIWLKSSDYKQEAVITNRRIDSMGSGTFYLFVNILNAPLVNSLSRTKWP